MGDKMSSLLPHLLRYEMWQLGPVVITSTVVRTWIVMIVLFSLIFWLSRGLSFDRPSRRQAVLEMAVEGFYAIIDPILGKEGRRYVYLVGGYFTFIIMLNLSWFIPGFLPPTTDIMTTAALAVTAMIFIWGTSIRLHGIGGHIKHYLQPLPFMAPLNIIEDLVRPFSLAVRLFGNMFGGDMVVLVFGILVPVLLPIPIMGLEVLFGSIQAFVFALLVTTYLRSAVHGH